MNCSSFGVSYGDALNKTAEVGQNDRTLGSSFVRVAWVPHEGSFTLDMTKKTVADFNQMGKN